MEKEAEIAVVGAGPAGSFTALTLAKYGLGQKTVVFEEHSQIGKPSHCAGHLNIKTLKRLRINLPEKIVENKIRGAKFCSPGGLCFRIERKQPVTVVVNRELFDKMIAEKAEKLGVQFFLNFKAKNLLIEDKKVKGVLVREKLGDTNIKLYSKLVVDAEGSSALLLKRANLPYPSSNMVYGVHAEVDKVEDVGSDIVEVYLGEKVAPGFYAWIIPRRDGTAKVGLAVKRGNPKDYFFQFMRNHPVASKKLAKSKVLRLNFHPITLGGPIHKTFWNGLLVVGDSASQVKPTTGGGVIMGMICARLAGKTAFKAFELNDFSEKTLAEYQTAWRKKIGFDMEVMLQLRRMLNKLSDKQIDKLFKLCIETGFNEIIEKAGDVDFQGKSLLRMAMNPKSFIPLLYLVWAILTGR